jgi:hypothetical protein
VCYSACVTPSNQDSRNTKANAFGDVDVRKFR